MLVQEEEVIDVPALARDELGDLLILVHTEIADASQAGRPGVQKVAAVAVVFERFEDPDNGFCIVSLLDLHKERWFAHLDGARGTR